MASLRVKSPKAKGNRLSAAMFTWRGKRSERAFSHGGKTRNRTIVPWAGRSQAKAWWRSERVLTCKSVP